MATVTVQRERTVREDLLVAALALLDEHGPHALQTRKIAAAAGTSTMAVYTHFGGLPQLITAVTEEGLRQFDAALTLPPTDDPVADLLSTGIVYRTFAIGRPHLYRLMFGSTSAHGINAPAHNMLTLGTDQIDVEVPSFAHLVRGVQRSIEAGRLTAATPESADGAVVAAAAQFWTVMHGFMMLELAGFFGDADHGLTAAIQVLSPMTISLLVALGDTPERAAQSLAAAAARA
ncbi:TetR family transcriptional regulator [Mycolicibacter minnesotensis]|uniref:TetR family transcriptional regulator n=1 Tax=Mycolicibacter minnesotensis TaxID=1118379 RepID=A0A7I7R6N8_9MYCO|nr:TetR/AcrR family transcriptional regulator [Mycolicibacter minnesotensis]ORB03962.1 TetR family transcriptional regulator [Mycolicibacter minnesotensis]BBY34281.1 TetR family transcriptional regulator [Mycolicibacter minnesotensis]